MEKRSENNDENVGDRVEMIIAKYSFLSLSHSTDLILKSSTDEFFTDFMLLFVSEGDVDEENQRINIQCLQKNTPELRLKVEAFINKYKEVNVKVFQFRSYLQKLVENESFLIWPNHDLTADQRTEFYNYLSSIKDGVSFETLSNGMKELFGALKETYKIYAFDVNTKKAIGEPDKSKRVCRFCANKRADVTFKNIAHAISESLGNKQIILNEECDECNSEFGSGGGIEESLITYLKVFGLVFGVKGKSGIPKMKGRNFEMSNEEGQLVIKRISDTDDEAKNNISEKSFRLDSLYEVVHQDIYRTLCKYFLSVVDSDDLKGFQNTIDWINRKRTIQRLPKIGILRSYNFFKTHPSLIVYIRKNENYELPYCVGEFHFTYLTLVFIVPLVDGDTRDFTDEKEYDFFWKQFKHYSSTKEWEYMDFSSVNKRKLTLMMNFETKGASENEKE